METHVISVAGRDRRYRRIVPSTPDPTAPLLLALHGTTQTGAGMRRFSGRTFDDVAERVGSDLVYLDGFRRGWNDARRHRRSAAQREDVDDVAFVSAVVQRYGRPVIAIGYSNGGQLVHRLLRERPGLLAGAAIIAAGLPIESDFLLSGVDPDAVPILLIHGTADPVVPYEGGPTRMLGRTLGTVRSAWDTAAAYAPPTAPALTRTGLIERADWGRVRLVTSAGTGHVIPNRRTSPRFVGPSRHDLDSGAELEDFFALRR